MQGEDVKRQGKKRVTIGRKKEQMSIESGEVALSFWYWGNQKVSDG